MTYVHMFMNYCFLCALSVICIRYYHKQLIMPSINSVFPPWRRNALIGAWMSPVTAYWNRVCTMTPTYSPWVDLCRQSGGTEYGTIPIRMFHLLKTNICLYKGQFIFIYQKTVYIQVKTITAPPYWRTALQLRHTYYFDHELERNDFNFSNR